MRKVSLFILFTLFSTLIFSQKNKVTIVYFKNGNVLKGQLINKNGLQKLETIDGSMYVVEMAAVDSISTQDFSKSYSTFFKKMYYRKERGFRNFKEASFLYNVTNSPITEENYYESLKDNIGIAIHTINGYQHWSYLFTGLGVGIERQIDYQQSFLPLYVRVSSEPFKMRISPFVFLDAGYSVMLPARKNYLYSYYKNSGGVYLATGLGLRFYSTSKASTVISLQYKYNQNSSQYQYAGWNSAEYHIKRIYQRLGVSVGISF